MFWRCSISTGADPAVLPGMRPGGCGTTVPSSPASWDSRGHLTPKPAMKITPSFTLGKTLKIIQFYQIKHYIPTPSPAAKTRALKFPESHPMDFPFPGKDSLCSVPRQGQAAAPTSTGWALPSQSQPRVQPGCSCRAAQEPPKSTRLSWRSAQRGIKERLENPGKRFNMSSDKQFLTRWPKLGFLGFFCLGLFSSPFSWNSSGVSWPWDAALGWIPPPLWHGGFFWRHPRCDTLAHPV